jgi:hypothetical protein
MRGEEASGEVASGSMGLASMGGDVVMLGILNGSAK